ncbi:DNA-processing protein DprA [Arcanobacterium hippocoleae]
MKHVNFTERKFPKPTSGEKLDYTAESEAALVWSAITEGDDIEASRIIDQYGYAAALEKLKSADSSIISESAQERWFNRLAYAQLAPLESYTQRGYSLVLRDSENWPSGLADLGERRPLCLWVYGDPEALANPMIGIVGSRDATSEGARSALDLAYELAQEYVIVSGGAYGIDAQAHRGALLAERPTVIVSAAGVDRVYPKQNLEIFQRCVENGGAVVSESIPGAAPHRHRFLLRNRIIAAISKVVIVVEAGLRSGALNTARHALEIGREVGAFPGSVCAPQCAGTNHLIRNGATLVMNTDHVRELAGAIGSANTITGVESDGGFTIPLDDEFDPLANRIYDVLSKVRYEPADIIAHRVGCDVVSVRMKLNRLTLAGRIVIKDGKWRKA